MLRQFLSRSSDHGFVNVISQNYILRQYMCSNARLFLSDSKAIPSFASEFAFTRRNLVLKILMMVINGKCQISELKKQYIYFGIEHGDDILETTLSLIEECFGIKEEAAVLEVVKYDELMEDGGGSVTKEYVEISDGETLSDIFDDLISAYYVAEDDREASYFLGSRLMGQIYQSLYTGPASYVRRQIL